ncbi:MAG: hypothetical protein WC348_04470 [Patescibacteria group bacterium]
MNLYDKRDPHLWHLARFHHKFVRREEENKTAVVMEITSIAKARSLGIRDTTSMMNLIVSGITSSFATL